MDYCSYFIDNKALFGSFPTPEGVKELEENGVRYFINLTCDGESKIKPYKTQYETVRYPIKDQRVPSDWNGFTMFIITLTRILNKLKDGEKMYVHCKGGHGRSGIVVACLLTFVHSIPPADALDLTSKYHANRVVMRERWRRLGSPQNDSQRAFVRMFFKPLKFHKAFKTGHGVGLSNLSNHPVSIKGFGDFPTSDEALKAVKDRYVSKKPGEWDEIKEGIMYNILLEKFRQNSDILKTLTSTGFRPFISESKHDNYWSTGVDGSGINMLGKLLCKARMYFYLLQHDGG